MKFTRIKHINVDGLYGHMNYDLELPYYNAFITGNNGTGKSTIFESISSRHSLKRFDNISVELYSGKSFKSDGKSQEHSDFLEHSIFIDFNELMIDSLTGASDGLSVLDERIEMLVHKSMDIEAYLELEENKDSPEAKKFYHIKNKLELVMRDALKSDDFIFDIENVKKIQKNHIKIFLFTCIKTAIAAFNKNIVIFDTPENKFSVSWQRVFVKRMRKINIQSQFIFITHSSHIASSDGMKNIVRI